MYAAGTEVVDSWLFAEGIAAVGTVRSSTSEAAVVEWPDGLTETVPLGELQEAPS